MQATEVTIEHAHDTQAADERKKKKKKKKQAAAFGPVDNLADDFTPLDADDAVNNPRSRAESPQAHSVGLPSLPNSQSVSATGSRTATPDPKPPSPKPGVMGIRLIL